MLAFPFLYSSPPIQAAEQTQHQKRKRAKTQLRKPTARAAPPVSEERALDSRAGVEREEKLTMDWQQALESMVLRAVTPPVCFYGAGKRCLGRCIGMGFPAKLECAGSILTVK